VERSKGRVFDVALLDIKLPDMEGTKLLTTLHEDLPRMVKIMITGYPTLENAVEALNLGANGYVMKPVKAEELLTVVEEGLREREEAEEKYEVSRIMNADNIDIVEFGEKVGPERLAGLSVLNSQGVVNTASAKLVLEEMYKTGKDASDIVAQRGLSQISDASELEDTVAQVIEANPQALADFRTGKEQALKFLVGQVMKATRGRANPQLVNELLKKGLKRE